MEMTTTNFSGSVKRYFRRKQYERLDVNGNDGKAIRLGGKRKRSWNIRAIRKLRLRFRLSSPVKLLAKFRDAYVNMMLGLSGNVTGESFFGKNGTPKAKKVSKISKAEEIQDKLILEIYKSLKASRDLASQ